MSVRDYAILLFAASRQRDPRHCMSAIGH